MALYLLLAAAALVVYLYLGHRKTYSRFSRYGVKGLPVLPLLGNSAPVMFRKKHLVEAEEDLYNEFPNERFVGTYDLKRPTVLIRDIDLLKQIAVKDYEHFLDHSLSINTDVDPVFGRVLFILKGQEWKDMRSILSPAFTSSKIRNMVPLMADVGKKMMMTLKKQLKESPTSYIDIDCHNLASRYANDVIASCAFGLHVDSYTEQDNEFYKMGSRISDFKSDRLRLLGFAMIPSVMLRFGVTLLSPALRNFFMDIVKGSIKDREEKGIHRPDMIHLLMEAQKGRLTYDTSSAKDADAGFATVEESEVGKKSVVRVWTDIDLTAQAVVFFLAGYDTISTGMTFLMYELALNPDVQDKLVKEIREHDEKIGGKLDYTTIQSMTYLDMVISELLRRWTPAVQSDRLCIKDYNLGKPNKDATKDYIIKAGEPVKIPLHAIHSDPNFYPNPTKFDPERFSDENKHKIKPGTFIPFGIGPRNCIGSRFALCELKVMIYQLLLHIELSPCDKTPIPAELDKHSTNLRIKGGHYLRMKLRK